MNTHFNIQRQIAALRIDTIKGSMKGYHKAHELKSKSRVTPLTPGGLSTSFPPGFHFSRRSVSERNNPPTHTAAENPSHGSAKRGSSPKGLNRLDGMSPSQESLSYLSTQMVEGRTFCVRFPAEAGILSAQEDTRRVGRFSVHASSSSQTKTDDSRKDGTSSRNLLHQVCEDLGVAYLGN